MHHCIHKKNAHILSKISKYEVRAILHCNKVTALCETILRFKNVYNFFLHLYISGVKNVKNNLEKMYKSLLNVS